jgi:hypothetical protein
MVDLETIHAMLVQMHGGILTLTVICIFAMVITKFYFRIQRTNKGQGILSRLDPFVEKLILYRADNLFGSYKWSFRSY